MELLGLLGLFLGWLGWGVLAAGAFVGLLAGSAGLRGLLATRRAGLRTAVAFGPWLIVGAVVALALAGRGGAGLSVRDGGRVRPAWEDPGHAALADRRGVARPALVAVLEGLPAGVAVRPPTSPRQLARRRLGYGRGARMAFEQDEVKLLGGVRHGRTQGGPVAIRIGNTEWPKWETVMSRRPGRRRRARRARPATPR